LVLTRLAELRKYQEFIAKVRSLPAPQEATQVSDLEQIDRQLQGVTIPKELTSTWIDTEAAKILIRRKAECAALQQAIEQSLAKLNLAKQAIDSVNQIHSSESSPINWPAWSRNANALLAQESPVNATEPLPVENVASSTLKYADVLKVSSVHDAEAQW